MTQSYSRSQSFFNEDGVSGLTHRAFTAAMGYGSADMSRPLIGICNTYSELNPCNSHLRQISEAVKRGVLQAGGFPWNSPPSLSARFTSAQPPCFAVISRRWTPKR